LSSETHYIWDDVLATGVAKIDEQHKQLFAAVNSLIDAIEEGRGNEEVKKSVDCMLRVHTLCTLSCASFRAK
jgi:hemerythrin